jgi:hypothetical protein
MVGTVGRVLFLQELFGLKSLRMTSSISQKIDQHKQGEPESNSSSQPFHGRSQSFQGQPGSVQPYEYQNGSGRLNGHSNGGHYGGLKNGQMLKNSNGASAAGNGRSVSPLQYVLCLTALTCVLNVRVVWEFLRDFIFGLFLSWRRVCLSTCTDEGEVLRKAFDEMPIRVKYSQLSYKTPTMTVAINAHRCLSLF